MQGLKNSLLLVGISLLSACAKVNSVQPFDQEQVAILLQQHYVSQPAQQMIAIQLPRGQAWKRMNTYPGSPLMLVPEKANASNWQESIHTNLISRSNKPRITLAQFMANEIDTIKQHCQQVSTTLLAETPDSLIYSVISTDCENHPDEKQIAKVLHGKDAVYFINYTAIISEITMQQYTKMSGVIQRARLISNIPPH